MLSILSILAELSYKAIKYNLPWANFEAPALYGDFSEQCSLFGGPHHKATPIICGTKKEARIKRPDNMYTYIYIYIFKFICVLP